MAEQTHGSIIRLGVWTCWPDYLSLISSKLLTFAKYHSRLQVEILDDKDAMQTITKGTPEGETCFPSFLNLQYITFLYFN